ncbi:MAG: stage V sporulation protein SpoVM [Ruminococcus sp.]|nr:stage V sporulation protein SpoVM [Ruminococcus sp.]
MSRIMKVVVIRSPKFLSGVLRVIFGIKKSDD